MATKGEPYAKVKERARYLYSVMISEEGATAKGSKVIALLIESAPEKALDALCAVMDE